MTPGRTYLPLTSTFLVAEMFPEEFVRALILPPSIMMSVSMTPTLGITAEALVSNRSHELLD